MRFFTFPALLAAALFSAVVVLPFLPLAKTHSDLFALEARMTSSAAGEVKVYFDSGTGFSETASVRAPIAKTDAPVVIRLPVPVGSYRVFRFDPLDRDGTTTIAGLRLVTRHGRTVREFALNELKPANQIASLRERGGALEIVSTPGANDPQLALVFAPPLVIEAKWFDLFDGLVPLAGGVFVAFALLLLALERVAALREAAAASARWIVARPGRGVAVVAAAAVIASAYPVVFLGKSFVSPNSGTVLLYDNYPTLPGYTSGELLDTKGADTGAVMWAHLPYSSVQHDALMHGELPLWNRYNSAGTPLLGQGQSMFGDPLHFLVVLCDGAAWAWDLKFLIAKWLFATALGLLVLAVGRVNRPGEPRLGGDASPYLGAALIVGGAAPFIGFYAMRFNHPAVFSVAYAPWVLYAWVRVTQAASARGAAAWAAGLILANWTLMNSGTAKEAYMLLLTMNFSGACVLLAADAPWRTRLAKFVLLGWAGVLFVLLSAPVWATFLNTLKNSYTAYNAASAFQIQPSLLLGAFDEIFYRPLNDQQFVFNPSLNFLLLLGFLYFLATLRLHTRDRLVMALAVSSLGPLALAFGLVPASWIVRVPFLANVAHIDNTFTCALLVLWSVLAGVGFMRAARRLGTPEGRGDLIVGALLLGALVFAWVAFRQTVHRSIYTVGGTYSALQPGQVIPVATFVWTSLAVLLAASVALAWTVRRALGRGTLTPPLAIVGALCVLVMLWRFGLHARTAGFENYVLRPVDRVDLHAKSPAMEYLRAAVAHEPGRGFGLHGNYFGGWTGVYRLESLYGPDALVNPWYREVVSSLPGVERIWEWRLYAEPANVATARPYLDALNVRWYLDLASDQGLLGRALRLVKVADLDIYESPTAWPRAFFANRVMVYDQLPEFLEKVKHANGQPFAAVQRSDLLTRPALEALDRTKVEAVAIAAKNYSLTPNTTSFTVRATGPGVIVLNEVFWPGDFRAELNGQKVPVVRLNHAFKGIVVDGAGDCQVTFRYVPKNWPRNLALSGLGALLLAGTVLLARRIDRAA